MTHRDQHASAGSDWVFPPPRPATATHDGRLFPVRRIYCVGRNYAEHALEMGSDSSEPPFYFQKPADAIQQAGADGFIANPYPSLTEDYQPEVELVVALKRGGTDIAVSEALSHVFGFAVGLDMTRRDLQRTMKDKRRPWEVAKAFDYSAPLGPLVPIEASGPMMSGEISLSVNDAPRQRGDLSDMILDVAALIADISKGSELRPGDLIFTGTPAGVASVQRTDVLVGHIDGLPDLRVRIV